MIVVSNDFKTAMKQPVKELQAFIEAESVAIRDEDYLISFKISCESGMCKSAMRKLEAKYLGEHNLLGEWVTAGFGVKLASGAYEYLNYGKFLVSELTFTKDTGTTTIVAYDKMVNTMKPYDVTALTDIEYPIDLYSYTQILCGVCGLTLGNDSFPVNGDLAVERELWSNINGITYRDIFVQIAQATASTCVIGNDDCMYFKSLNATGEQLTYDNMFKLKLEPVYGEINSVVLSRTPQEDNVYLRDEESIQANELTEFKIENNEILDKDRENAITPIFEVLRGVSYYPFEATTEGLGWYEIGDSFDIVNDAGDVFNTSLFNFSITVDGGIKETLKTAAETKTQTQYQYATSLEKRIKNTELVVNKQDGTIQGLVSDMYDVDGIVNEQYTKVTQRIDAVEYSVQNSGGNNLIKNSVMFAYDNKGMPIDWELLGDGTVSMASDTQALANGGLSGHTFTLRDKTARQIVRVNVGEVGHETKYTFSTKIKKGADGSCYVKLYNENPADTHTIEVPEGTEVFYKDYELKGITPTMNYYYVEFFGSADSDATFTDNMLSVGEYKSQWTQANGEVMNTQVNINLEGVLVKSNRNDGSYTVMSPIEFTGYASVNGTVMPVFSLNRDVTKVKKLEVEDEVTMPPVKVVPITKGPLQGWAFVPST